LSTVLSYKYIYVTKYWWWWWYKYIIMMIDVEIIGVKESNLLL
jgi:hypothetical protein